MTIICTLTKNIGALYACCCDHHSPHDESTRIILPGGNPNPRQDIFKLCRRAPGPSEFANHVEKYILCDEIFQMKKIAAKMSDV